MSTTTMRMFVKSNSSSVDLNASIMYAGNLLINPTVSESKNGWPLIVIRLVVVERVVNSCLLCSWNSPVILLNSVVFPDEV